MVTCLRTSTYCFILVACALSGAYPMQQVRGQAVRAIQASGRSPSTLPAQAHLSGFSVALQKHALSCEAAVASMETHGRISEQTILAHMPHNANPWLGFRGNVDGGQSLANGLANYGIYAPPLARELQGLNYQTVVITGTTAPALLRYSVGVLRQPVAVWVTHYLGDWPAITGHAVGRSFTLVDGEHARLAIGYDTHGIYTLDPLQGARYDTWTVFLQSWARFDYMGMLAATTLPRPPAPTIHASTMGSDVTWQWSETAGAVASDVTLFRQGRPLRRLLVATAPQSARATVLGNAVVRAGTVVADTAPVSSAQINTVRTAQSQLAALTHRAGLVSLTLQLAQSIPYSLTVRAVDPLGLASAIAVSPAAVDPAPPQVPTGLQASISGSREARWTWRAVDGLTYRVVSFRYLGSHPVDMIDILVGHAGVFRRTVRQGLTYYAQVLAVGDAGASSAATPPDPAPVITEARLVGSIRASLQHGGYGAWQWTARGARQFIVRSYAYAGSQVVDVQQTSTKATTYRRRLIPGLTYHVAVQAVANDGERSVPRVAAHGLVYVVAHPVVRLRVQALPGGQHRWTWAAQPRVRYLVQLTRYTGRHGSVVERALTDRAQWVTPPTPRHEGDYLQVWAVDACGDRTAPVQLRA
jgi:uncharacterized protein YvpB